jgi:hypothetical protein
MSTSPVSWRPPQWAKPAQVMITVPAGTATTNPDSAAPTGSSVNAVNTTAPSNSSATAYVFDAVLALEHDQTLVKTQHPVQSGPSVSSHAYIQPAELVLYVLMSDVTPQYASSAQTSAPYIQPWTGNPSKSVSAYQQMLNLQSLRTPLTVTTRLRTYYNMLIMKIAPREDEKTTTGARFRIEFGQLFVASTQAAPASARPNDTQSTGLGAQNVQQPSSTVNNQFGVNTTSTTVDGGGVEVTTQNLGPSTASNIPFIAPVDVPGAGDYSSVNVNSVPSLTQ